MKDNNYSNWVAKFIIQPFWAAVSALFNANEKGARLILVLFTGLYGLYAIPQLGSDMYGYLHSIDNGYSLDLGGAPDYYKTIISYVISRFTHNGHILLCVFGLICGYFFSKSIQIYCESEDKNWRLAMAILLFANVYSLCILGGVRNATAFYLFFWGSMSFLIKKDYRYLFAALFSIFIHFSFIVYVAAFLFGYLINRFPAVVYILFLFSLIISFSGVGAIIGQSLHFFGDGIQNKGDIYLGAAENYKLYTTGLSGSYIRYASYGCMFLCLISSLLLKSDSSMSRYPLDYAKEDTLYRMLLCVLVLFSFSNIFSSVPHLSGRFETLCVAFTIYPVFLFTRRCSNRTVGSIFFALLIASLALTFIFEVRKTSEFTPIGLVTLPLPFVGLFETNVWELIDSIL